jgi:microcompartment protein CcmK/EutM
VILGRVVGEVWGARRHHALDGRKLLLVRPHFWYAPAHEAGALVALDAVGAGVGEDVVICLGDGARRTLQPGPADAPSPNLPVDAAVLGIVDRVELAADRGARPLTFVGGGSVPEREWP